MEMTEVTASELVKQLNEAAKAVRFWPWFLILTLGLSLVSPLFLIPGGPLTLWLFWKDQVRRKVVVFYDVAGEDAHRFQRSVDSFKQAAGTQRAWQIIAAGEVRTTHQHKVNAGASSVVSRIPLIMTQRGPRNIATNIAMLSLTTAQRSLYLLPDRVLVRDGKHYADVAYDKLTSLASIQHFVEDEMTPSDSVVLGHTWQFVNVKGGPDRRFKNNRMLPILEYGRLTLASDGGYRALLDFSTPEASSALARGLAQMTANDRQTASPPPLASSTHTSSASIPVSTPHPKPTPATPQLRPGTRRTDHSRTIAGASFSRRRLSADGRVAVVGESHYQSTLDRIAHHVSTGANFDNHLPVVASLIPEPGNPHDDRAVRVDLDSASGPATVGYLCRTDARAYQPVLLRLRECGYVGVCPGRIAGGGPERLYGVYLHLAGPEALLLENLLSEADLLEPARQVTVTREEDHQAILALYHPTARSISRVAAELTSSAVSHGKHKGSYAVEIQLDGRRVGELTAAMSNRYKDIVVTEEQRGRQVICEGVITYGSRGYQIDLRLPHES
ncbi:hypothetical protein ABZ639_09655 [Saccharomonospora sp. NPDC006951]